MLQSGYIARAVSSSQRGSAAAQEQGHDFSIFILEQSPRYKFNRGALLNAGVLLLQGSDYDWFVFHDVDTIPTATGAIKYARPSGKAPSHLTPSGIHPKVQNYEASPVWSLAGCVISVPKLCMSLWSLVLA